jgi:hypothetical protein
VARPLRKLKLDGTPYRRRQDVEAEIASLDLLSPGELEARCVIWYKTARGFISDEALLYFVRTANGTPAHQEVLFAALIARLVRLLPVRASSDGTGESLTSMNIREDVCDHFVDLLLADREEYELRLDYFEVNFNSAVSADRYDARKRHWKHENRTGELGSQDSEVSEEVEAAVGGHDPFDAHELDNKIYRLHLDEAIESLPVLQQRIIEMLRQEIPIDSKDPSVVTISKALGRSEKTIRTHRDKAFKTLRARLESKGRK